jgi:hypothetical protein
MARPMRKVVPYAVQPRRADGTPEVWDVQRDIILLTTRLTAERDALTNWQRRIALRATWESRHAGATQLPLLRQETAATHARVLELERRLLDARRLLRILLARQDAH